ncbi:hypothetical protein PoB_007660800 [Plakobranchus ocellatus]|uniref:Uncharacterized protein n=1 Tax=Plakobranchus ocellatus TaxID=259542 RepID=A0AAV4E0N3_9GAST|nr:hypothetical protein PoB_007660800 [Plakobranchus ocellatus]
MNRSPNQIGTFKTSFVGTVANESALISAGAFLSWVRAPPPAPLPDGRPESLRSPCCGLAKYKKRNKAFLAFLAWRQRYRLFQAIQYFDHCRNLKD